MMLGLIFASIAASAAIMIILLLRKFFKNKVFSKVFVLLWMLVIIRLLVPFEFSSALSVYPSETKVFSKTPEDNVQIQWELLPDNAENALLTEFEPAETPAKTKAKISSADILFAVWAFGAVSVGGYFFAKHIRTVKRIEADCIPFEDIPDDFPRGKTRFLKSKNLASPLSFGLFRPTAVIPENISAEQLPFVLLHEHTHIKDRDAVLKTAAVFALSLHWFNPLVWTAVRYLDRDIERWCDERVLSSVGSEKTAGYANAILDFAERESLSLSFFSAASLEERVISIMKNKTKRSHLPAVIAVFVATLLIMTACGTVPKPEENEPLSAGNLSEGNGSVGEIIADISENANSGADFVIDTNTGEISEGKIQEAGEELDEIEKELSETEKAAQAAEELDKGLQNAIEFVWPCGSVRVTAEFGSRTNHSGIDIFGENGSTEIYAAANGVVSSAIEDDAGYGHYIVIDHGDGIQTLYAHCSELLVAEGDTVFAGDTIAKTGSSGNSTGPHLHFEVILSGRPVDPMKYVEP